MKVETAEIKIISIDDFRIEFEYDGEHYLANADANTLYWEAGETKIVNKKWLDYVKAEGE
jgi:hypothetical protein